eukprot:1507254-Karenia_brevis.AAC.1
MSDHIHQHHPRDSNPEALVEAGRSESDSSSPREDVEGQQEEREIIQSRGRGERSNQNQRILNDRRGEDEIGGVGNPLR